MMNRFAACALALALMTVSATGQTVPTGFFHDVVVVGLTQPLGLAFLPDGRLLIIEQHTFAVKVWTGAGNTASLVGTVPAVQGLGGEEGLLAIAVDPAWPARPFIYVWYCSSTSPNMKLSRFTVTGSLSDPTSTNLALGDQYDVLVDTPSIQPTHNGGCLRFGPDGMLYVSMGEDEGLCDAQDRDALAGCVLRLDVSSLPAGAGGPPAKSLLVPAGNPFTGPGTTDNEKLVWCHGLRNPFRFHIDPVTGHVFIADVGGSAWEEIDISTTGGENFGWPWHEGPVAFMTCTGSAPPINAPIATWSHATGATSIMSAGLYRNVSGGTYNFGPAYEGDYFYLCYGLGAIRRLQYNGSTWVTAPQVPGQPSATDWATGFHTVADAIQGPDGAIYVARQYPGSVRRIRPDPNLPTLNLVSGNAQAGNAGKDLIDPLVVRLTTTGGSPIAGQVITFGATGSATVNPPSAVTDAQGYASTVCTLTPSFIGHPVVTATAAGASMQTFTATWRGLTHIYVPALNYFSLTVWHSQTNAPVTVTAEAPPVGVPYLATPFGDLWTSVVAPLPGFVALDGMGLYGPPVPSFVTGPAHPLFTITIPGLPPLGVTLLLQAFSVDSALLPAFAAYVVTNPEIVTFN